jgi:hypothetical protein
VAPDKVAISSGVILSILLPFKSRLALSLGAGSSNKRGTKLAGNMSATFTPFYKLYIDKNFDVADLEANN